jgi:2-methylcitrate dehydratase PrpD
VGSVLNETSETDEERLRRTASQAFETCLRNLLVAEWTDFPEKVRRRAAMIVADNVASTFSAITEPEIQCAMRLASLHAGGDAVATLLVKEGPCVSLLTAATQNALAMGWNELDEGYRKAVCHGGLYVLPALMAVAEQQQANAQEVLRALVLSYEIVTRIARVWRQSPMLIHPHALLAPVGAAAAVAIIRRLPDDVVIRAVAGACALGMAGPFNQALEGVLVRNTWAAQGAAMGLMAVEHAIAGIGGWTRTPFDVYATALGMQTDVEGFREQDEWAVVSGYQKLNACCQYAHSTIEAIQALIKRQPQLLGGEEVLSIDIAAHPLAYGLTNAQPSTTLGAKFSIPHAAAAAMVHGHGGAIAFDHASLSDTRITRLRTLVSMRPFPESRPWPNDRPATVTVTTSIGVITETCWSARGGPDRPFEEADVWEKIDTLCLAQAPFAAQILRDLVTCTSVDANQHGSSNGLTLTHTWQQWMRALTRSTAVND